MKKIATYTLGCKVNQYETRAIEEIFIKNGYQLVAFFEYADVYLINTCTVTAMSDRKSRQIIRRAKNINPKALVVVIGCYSQQKPEEVAQIKDVNLVLGTTDKKKIVNEVEKLSNTAKTVKVRDVFEDKEFEDIRISSTSTHTRAFLKIQDGCDRFCSYCIIPYTRGRVKSKKIESIVDEVKSLVENNYKEVVLTGIHLASYGKDLRDVSLGDVIDRINSIHKIKRIRLGSIEPLLINDVFLEKISKSEKLCPSFHISLQSGSDETLKRMNRRYSAQEYYKSVLKIREHYDNPAITTDVIVGFPGETDDEFQETYEFLKKVNFYQTHIFKFSPREGTKAYDMSDQIKPSVKNQRSKILIDLSDKNKKKFEENMIGKVEEVLFEEREGDYFTGHTKNLVKIYVKTDLDLSARFECVNIVDINKEDMLIGKI